MSSFFDLNSKPKITLKKFENLFILNTTVRNYLLDKTKNKLVNSELVTESTIQLIIRNFNGFVISYVNDMLTDFSTDFKAYARNLSKLFFTNLYINQKKDLSKVFIDILFNNDDNKIIFFLFPELRLYFQEFSILFNFKDKYKLYHLLFSIIIFKFHIIIPLFKNEFDTIKDRPEVKITESLFFKTFILETRCLICFFGFYIFNNNIKIKQVIIQTFISYVRIMNPYAFKYFLIGNFFDIGSESGLEKYRVHKIQVEFKTRTYSSLNFYQITTIFSETCEHKNDDPVNSNKPIDYTLKYSNEITDNENLSDLEMKYFDLEDKIAKILESYIKNYDNKFF